MFFITMCVPPSSGPEDDSSIQKAQLDSLRRLKCPRYMSSAAEYYRNRNWRETVQMYSQIIELFLISIKITKLFQCCITDTLWPFTCVFSLGL